MRKPVDHMITLSKRGTLHARRQVRFIRGIVTVVYPIHYIPWQQGRGWVEPAVLMVIFVFPPEVYRDMKARLTFTVTISYRSTSEFTIPPTIPKIFTVTIPRSSSVWCASRKLPDCA